MKYLWGALTALNYILALFMMYAGYATGTAPVAVTSNHFGWIYGSRFALLAFGLVFFVSGLSLFVAKITRRISLIGHSLMAIYLCFVFGAVLNAMSGTLVDGLPNLFASGIVALLYLRWKYKYRTVLVKE